MNWDWEDNNRNGCPIESAKRVSNLDHEIRSTLHSLMGYLEIFDEETLNDLNENQQHLLHRITHFTNHLAGLITDTIEFLRTNTVVKE